MRALSAFALVLGLAACGDPLAGLDRLSDVDVDQTDPAAAALPDAEEIAREGFLGTPAAEGADVPAQAQTTQAPGGLLGGLLRRAQNADPAAAVAADVAQSQSQQTPAAQTEVAALAADAAPARRGGLFGALAPGGSAPRDGPDARDVTFGTTLAFGEIARVCDARGKALGSKVGQTERRGLSLYDSNPAVLSKRTFYITGFDDNCPRQFTAANALLGAPSTYEQLRFGPAGQHLPYAATDQAYDRVKSSVCGARKTKPCGSKIGRLDRNTAFLSAYEFTEHNGRWKEFLMHDGAVLATAVKSAN
ncbi:hypothetical protein KDD17_01925 [Sulfitobacter albidus]|uniref:Uncharacterized protein n=1 Tax=Sulfitobacter albidus TaxID=2829501 RepID=A0A975JF39_9RHOB|nr:hypothetical protein [Sulfitobacter albidus]QUJ76845.1 hypothetical protein KDD17_01925 [Sulfitobacter albidus]